MTLGICALSLALIASISVALAVCSGEILWLWELLITRRLFAYILGRMEVSTVISRRRKLYVHQAEHY